MDIKQKLKEEKKKLIAYALTTGITITGLTGCAESDMSKKNNGCANYDYMKECDLVTLNYKDGNEVVYVAHREADSNIRKGYDDIKTGECVLYISRYTSDGEWKIDNSFVDNYEIEDVTNFLVKEKNIKDWYEKKDIDKIIEDYKKYRKDINKVLIK